MFEAMSECLLRLDWLLELVLLKLSFFTSDSFSSGIYSEESKLDDLDLTEVGVEMLSLEGLLCLLPDLKSVLFYTKVQ